MARVIFFVFDTDLMRRFISLVLGIYSLIDAKGRQFTLTFFVSGSVVDYSFELDTAWTKIYNKP